MPTTDELLAQAGALLGQLLMDGGDVTEESEALIETWLEGSADKIGGCRAIRLQIQRQIELLRDEERRIAKRRKALETRQGWVEEKALSLLHMQADFGGEMRIKTEAYSAWVQASASVDFADPKTFDLGKVPDDYLTPQKPRLNKAKARQDMIDGKEIPELLLVWRETVRFT